MRFKNKRLSFSTASDTDYVLTNYWDAFGVDKTKVAYYCIGVMHQQSGCVHMSSIRYPKMYTDGTAEIFPVSNSMNGWGNNQYGNLYTGSCRFDESTIRIGSLTTGHIILLYVYN